MSGRYTPELLEALSDIFTSGIEDHGHEWYLGSIGVWKSTALDRRPRPVPTYSRGSLVCDLRDDMSFVTVPFQRKGDPALAIVLRSADEDLFGGWTPAQRSDEAERIAAFLNRELDAARIYHREHMGG